MAKAGTKGNYQCKVGFYDIYSKQTNPKGGVVDFTIYHSKKIIEKGIRTKQEAISKATELLGTKYRAIYSL
jgi:hypothetical protein